MPRTVIVFVAFLCVLAASNSRGNRKYAEAYIGDEGSLAIPEIDDVKVFSV